MVNALSAGTGVSSEADRDLGTVSARKYAFSTTAAMWCSWVSCQLLLRMDVPSWRDAP